MPRTPKPTINDVAAAAGVSRATASRAMSNYGRISEVTAQQVRDAAAKIGYRPNQIAQAMRVGQTKTIGLVMIADFTNAFFDRLTKAIVDSAKQLGYQVVITNTDEQISAERQAVETLLQMRVAGLIVVPSSSSVHDHLAANRIANSPLVLVDRRLEGINASTVTTDDFKGAFDVVRHAASLGHKRLGFLIAAESIRGTSSERPALLVSTVEDRINGFMDGAAESGIKPKDQVWLFTEEKVSSAEDAARQILDAPLQPTVILTSNNDMALAVLKVAGQRKLQIGRDISLITIDDSAWAAAVHPGITVLSRPVEELGAQAVKKLIEKIEDPNTKPEKVVLTSEVLSRDSVANLVMYPELDPRNK